MKEITRHLCEMDSDQYSDQSRIEERTERRLSERGWGNRLGKALQAQGWENRRMRRDGRVQRLWFPPV